MSGKDMKSLYMIIAVLGVVLVSGCTDDNYTWWIYSPAGTSCGPHGYGDVNNDNFVNSIDAALILQHTSGLTNLNSQFPGLSPSSTTRGDVNGNSQVNPIDASLILQYSAGMITLNDFAVCSPTTCSTGNSPLTTSGICDEDCGSSPECHNKRPGETSTSGGICSNQCEGGCSAGCAGCGILRNADCSIQTDVVYCMTDQYCGNTIQHDTTCTAGCAGCSLFRESNCNGKQEVCWSDTFCAEPPSGTSCTPQCTGCNTLLTSDCRTIFDNYICSAYCSTPYAWPSQSTTISSCFSPTHPRGIDIDGFSVPDTPITALSPGIVVQMKTDCPEIGFYCSSCGGCNAGGVGNCVRVQQFDGKYAVYGHLKTVDSSITVGTPVGKGRALGIIGTSGCSTGTHLHLEIWSSDDSSALTNPCTYDGLSQTCGSQCS